MSTELKKKWYQGFALYTLIFLSALYMQITLLFIRFISPDQFSMFIYNIIIFFIVGFILCCSKKKIPLIEIFIFCIADIILISPYLFRIFCFKFVLELIGALFALILLLILKRVHFCKIKSVIKLKLFKFFRRENIINNRSKIVKVTFSIYIVLLFIIYFISTCKPSANLQICLYPPILFIAGVLIGYITQKIPIILLVVSMIAFYVPLKLIFTHLGLTFNSIYIAFCFLNIFYYYLSGACIGYGLYKHFYHLTKFEKFSLKKHYLSRKKG